jgi:murein DD-endopeptidase MepM/ murein hydrolase activator NlpD
MRVGVFILLGVALLAGCARNTPPAPVVYGPSARPPPVQEARRTPPTQAPAARPAQPRPQTRAEPVPRAYETHTVRDGETIYGIAREFGIDARDLVRLNAIPPPYRIQAGMTLKMPPKLPSQVASNDATALAPAAARPRSMEQPAPEALSAPAPAAQMPRLPAELPDPEPDQPSLAAKVPTETPTRAGSGFLWPVKGKLLTRFGEQGDGLHNDGINIAAPRGAPIVAAENGVVVYAGNELSGFGNLLILRHADGWMSAYGHIDAMRVRRGDTVRRGQVIATVGQTGGVSSPQLHFELRRGSTAVDPTRYLGGSGTAGLMPSGASRDGPPGPG